VGLLPRNGEIIPTKAIYPDWEELGVGIQSVKYNNSKSKKAREQESSRNLCERIWLRCVVVVLVPGLKQFQRHIMTKPPWH
jgi:hypothetical protein